MSELGAIEPINSMEASKAMSREFFEDSASYGRFSLTADYRSIIGCIEPRNPSNAVHGDYKIIVQTGGGIVGEGLDVGIALTALEGQLVTIQAGMDYDKNMREVTVPGAHVDCTFDKEKPSVTSEMANPSEFTLDSALGWAQYFNKRDLFDSMSQRVMDAAELQLEYLLEYQDELALLDAADRLYPKHTNVASVRGVNIARTYVTNLHPKVGLDRNQKPVDEEAAAQIQGYHVSLAGAVADIGSSYKMPRDVLDLRFVSRLLRESATRTVITRDKMDEMTFLEVRPAHNESGLVVVEQPAV